MFSLQQFQFQSCLWSSTSTSSPGLFVFFYERRRRLSYKKDKQSWGRGWLDVLKFRSGWQQWRLSSHRWASEATHLYVNGWFVGEQIYLNNYFILYNTFINGIESILNQLIYVEGLSNLSLRKLPCVPPPQLKTPNFMVKIRKDYQWRYKIVQQLFFNLNIVLVKKCIKLFN